MPLIFAAFGRVLGAIPWQVYAGIAGIIIFAIALYAYDHAVTSAATSKCVNQQVVVDNKTEEAIISALKTDIANRDAEIAALNSKNNALSGSIEQLQLAVKNHTGTENGKSVKLSNGSVAPVLSYTIEQLRSLHGSRP